ncbi:MAG: dockerin type I domain-containing protein [Verrucomicrobiota bacterium]|nr:dockerin type I domain-containing protein [Verrucomicrobiota bacterium]
MKSCRRVRSFPRWSLLFLALALSAASSFGQNVGGFLHAKIQNFQQTSPAAPVADAVQPFQFGSLITMGTATINSATLTFTGTASPRAYTGLTNGDFSILDTFATQAQLDSAYSTNGNYTVSINTSAGTFSRAVSFLLAFFGYPTTPRLTVPAADWQNSAIVIDATMPYTLTWGAFSNAQTADMIEVIIGNSTFGPFPNTQTSYTLPAGTLQPGTTYACDLAFLRGAGTVAGDANIGAGYALLVKETGFMIRTIAPALALNAAVSRKVHGAAGAFDIVLPLTGTPGVECRTGGATGDHTIVFTFNNPIVSGNAAVTGGDGSVSGAPTISNNTVTVNLTGVTNAQTTTVTLSNVTDSFNQVLGATSVSAGFLLGDTNGDRFVNGGDAIQTRNRSGQATDATNFRSDVNTDGFVNSGDSITVRARSGSFLP